MHDDEMTAMARTGPRVPAEWDPHAGTLMAWPWDDRAWPGRLLEAQDEIAVVARTIADFEPVLLVAPEGTEAEATRRCGSSVEVLTHPVDDCWTRDTGPVIACDATTTAAVGLDFRFNGWGGTFRHELDDRLPVGVCERLGVPRRRIDMVLEGGAVIQDGDGTVITTEECLLHPSRNPQLSRSQIEDRLRGAYGASTVVWLPWGLDENDVTDGHVDLVAAFVAPGALLVHTQPGEGTATERRMAANVEALQQARDARDRPFRVVEFRPQPRFWLDGRHVTTFSYLNFALCNGGVVVPLAGVPEDDTALDLIASEFPDRRVVGVPARTLAWNGGGVHCVTQPIPAGAPVRPLLQEVQAPQRDTVRGR